MFIKVYNDEEEMVFEGDSEEFLDENSWDEELEETLSLLESNKSLKNIVLGEYIIKKSSLTI